MEILLCGKSAQLCVVVAHLVVHGFHQALQSDNAEDTVSAVEHRHAALGVVLQPFDTALGLFAAVYIREAGLDKRSQHGVLLRRQQCAKLHRAAEEPVLCGDEQHGDVVVLLRLRHQRPGSLCHGHFRIQRDVIGAHTAADFVLVERNYHLHLSSEIIVQKPYDLISPVLREFPQHICRGVALHLPDYEDSL